MRNLSIYQNKQSGSETQDLRAESVMQQSTSSSIIANNLKNLIGTSSTPKIMNPNLQNVANEAKARICKHKKLISFISYHSY
jgi:hypothetical protein